MTNDNEYPCFKPLKMYVRNRKNQKVGVLYSFINYDKKVVFGWSLCSKQDQFNPYTGTTIAYERGLSNDRYSRKNVRTILPHTIKKAPELQKFLQKVSRYYRRKETPLHLFTDDIIYVYLKNR